MLKRGKDTRTRKITWLNPPFSMNVETNIEKVFVLLLNECFSEKQRTSKDSQKKYYKIILQLHGQNEAENR